MLNENKKSFAKRFLKLRKKLRLTQQEAADLFGIHITSWQDWEYGVSLPNEQHLKMLEDYESSPPSKTSIAQMCEFIRKKLGLKKMDMAKMVGVQLNTWGYWERDVMKPIGTHKERIEKLFKELQEPEALRKAS
jgi:DNA-binding transcriptional regulator YiaG